MHHGLDQELQRDILTLGAQSAADLVEFAVEAVDGRAEGLGAANCDPAIRIDDSLQHSDGFVPIEPMQRTANHDRLKDADV